ncbi:MAG TPA: lanthionine synthetase LanC family protein, partial [Puia sp.]|nr:lanthionine synthetase LanC family protein [Puia sp.]
RGFRYKKSGVYLQVNEMVQKNGWALHLSVINCQVSELLEILLPYFGFEELPFKIPASEDITIRLLDGSLGFIQLGKIIYVYPENGVHAYEVASRLLELTKGFQGPAIPSDVHLGGIVYSCYADFEKQIEIGADGEEFEIMVESPWKILKKNRQIIFEKPGDAEWPFESIKPFEIPKPRKIFKKRYIPVSVIKEDARGCVFKAIDCKNIFRPKWCFIKEGKACICADKSGRDMHDRLLWQHILHKRLRNKIPVPEPIDFFKDGADSYFVTEYLDGISLDQVIGRIYGSRHPDDLESAEKILLANYLIEIISLMSQLHKESLVHRDITPGNFFVTRASEIVMIDTELVFDLANKIHSPAFELGSSGYMSPAQFNCEEPSVKDDIYALGATIIALLTGLSPAKFETGDPAILKENLSYFIGDAEIVDLILRCLAKDPGCRPSLESMDETFSQYKNQIKGIKKHFDPDDRIESKLFRLVQEGIHGLSQEPLVNKKLLWPTLSVQYDPFISTQQTSLCLSHGLYEGMSGVMYFLSFAKKLGFDISSCERNYDAAREFIASHGLKERPERSFGLYSGAAGIAMAIAAGIESGQIEKSVENVEKLRSCFSKIDTSLSFANGCAGQMVAILQAGKFLKEDFCKGFCDACVESLGRAQLKDGSWRMESTVNKGFSRGVAGIAFALLCYYCRYPGKVTELSARKAMVWLFKHTCRKRNPASYSFGNGEVGVALTFIKAHEILKEEQYKIDAEKILSKFPPRMVSPFLSQADGLAGLGQIYLEAYRVFGNQEWRSRAISIASFVAHLTLSTAEGGVYWLVNNTNFPTADLMTGNSGILHFLISALYPEKSNHPLFN